MAQNAFYWSNGARTSDVYFPSNVVGVPSGITVTTWPKQTNPGLPRAITQQPSAIQSANELRNRAAYPRQMTGTVTTPQMGDDVLAEGGAALGGAGGSAGLVVRTKERRR
jgi:hypothetical protein